MWEIHTYKKDSGYRVSSTFCSDIIGDVEKQLADGKHVVRIHPHDGRAGTGCYVKPEYNTVNYVWQTQKSIDDDSIASLQKKIKKLELENSILKSQIELAKDKLHKLYEKQNKS